MPLNTCAVRMIPCHCAGEGGCKDQLTSTWDLGKAAQEQIRFKAAPNCELKPLLGDLNAWKFIETDLVQGASDKAKKQVNELLQMKSDQYLHTSRDNIKLLHFGAISCGDPEGFWPSGLSNGMLILFSFRFQPKLKEAPSLCRLALGFARGPSTIGLIWQRVGTRSLGMINPCSSGSRKFSGQMWR